MGERRRRSIESSGDDAEVDVETGTSAERGSLKEARPARRGQRILVITLAVALALSAGGWAATSLMKTPAELAADALPPAASIITGEVTKQVVANQLVTRGQVASSQSVNVLAGRQAAGASATVVTGISYNPGDEVLAGDPLIQLSGRPVFALKGDFSAYRDLSEGMTGVDVQQLQTALFDLGIFNGKDKGGTFGPNTTAAVTTLYDDHGYAGQVTLPASEVFYIASFPARVESSTVTMGSLASQGTFNVTTGTPSVRVTADPQILAVAKPGAPVEIVSETLNLTVMGKASGPAAAPAAPDGSASPGSTPQPSEPASGDSDAEGTGGASGGSGGGAPAQPVIDVVPDQPLGAEWIGQDVRVTFTDGSSDGEVLAVPVSAVSQRADGATVVTVVTGTGKAAKQTVVKVKVGVMGGGYVEVTPLGGATLKPGDDVLIGAA